MMIGSIYFPFNKARDHVAFMDAFRLRSFEKIFVLKLRFLRVPLYAIITLKYITLRGADQSL